MKKLAILSLFINLVVLAFCQETDDLDGDKLSTEEKYPKSVVAINIGYLIQAFRVS